MGATRDRAVGESGEGRLAGDGVDPGDEETRLMGRVAHGDRDACAALYDLHSAAVYTLLVRIVGDRDVAEELMQEALVRAWQHAASFDPRRGSLRGWLMGIAHNLALNELRRLRRRPRSPVDTLAMGDDRVLIEHPDPRPDTSEVAWVLVQQSELHRALQQLPPSQRKPVELYAAGYSQAEIANYLGEPIGTIKSRLRTAFRLLKPALRHLVTDHEGQ